MNEEMTREELHQRAKEMGLRLTPVGGEKVITYRLSKEKHERIRLASSAASVSMQRFIDDAVETALEASGDG